MLQPTDIRGAPSLLGPFWSALYSAPVNFPRGYFDAAMDYIISNPNVNSTILMRTDIYLRFVDGTMFASDMSRSPLDPSWLQINITDISPRTIDIPGYEVSSYYVRRNIPRNPSRDPIVNQSCILYTNVPNTDRVVVYVPHCSPDEIPYYLPKAAAVALVYTGPAAPGLQPLCSVHYLLHPGDPVPLISRTDSNREIRIGLHLLNTAIKHARGRLNGYQKRVDHDKIIDREKFQNRYILLKQKHAATLMGQWVEKTDPRKHVFEDLGIAAFLIELWSVMYSSPDDFEFLDLGCGNGLLVYILIKEGFKGAGIDVRERKSWVIYPEEVRRNLKAQIVVPDILRDSSDPLTQDPEIAWIGSQETGRPKFYIGNHSDELTLWLPLLNHPFMVIPCCSHSLSGQRTRFQGAGGPQKSAYSGLVDKVVEIAGKAGWEVETEMLRIPSTRSAAIIGRKRVTLPPLDGSKSILGAVTDESNFKSKVAEVLAAEGGAAGWVETARKLKLSKKDH